MVINKTYIVSDNILTPIGWNTKENMTALEKGISGLSMVSNVSGFFNDVCASLFDKELLNDYFDNVFNKSFVIKSRFEKLCALSVLEALKKTSIDLSKPDTLLILSTTKGPIDMLDMSKDNLNLNNLYLWESAKRIGKVFNAYNTPLVISNACVSGVLAVITADRMLRQGLYKHIVICGADIVTNFVVSGFQSFKALSDAPCRPFDIERKGLNLGEAAATLILSSDNNIHCNSNVNIGPGFSSNDATHISAPSRTAEGLFSIISKILQTSTHKQIDYISAHGTATVYNDEMEAVAIDRANLNNVPVNSLKAYWGHTLGAAGLLETIAAIYSLDHNVLIKSAGFSKTGTTPKINVITESKKQTLNSCIKLASGFGGCNAGLLLFID